MQVSPEIQVDNHLPAEVNVTVIKGIVTIDLRKCKPPVRITLSQPALPKTTGKISRKVDESITLPPGFANRSAV